MKTLSFSTLLRLLISLILGLGVSVAQAAAFQEITQYAYDANGNLTRVLDPLGQTLDHRYDALDRRLATQDALGGQILYQYDDLDRLTAVTDPLGLITRYTLDGLGNEREDDSPDSGRTERSYDGAGNLIAAIDARGRILRYTYDALNRMTRVDADQGSPITFGYDQGTNAVGRLSSLVDETGESTWQYDALGRVTAWTTLRAEATLRLEYVYDSNGRLLQIIYPSGQVIGLNWQNGRIAGMTQNGLPLLSNIEYQPFGPAAGWTWGNGSAYRRHFDLDGRPANHPLAQRESHLEYDAASRILALTDSDPFYNRAFAYDPLHRLLQANGPHGSQTFDYDANGNRIGESGSPYTYAPDSNRLQAQGNAAYVYDAAGNVLSDGQRHYTYDAHGWLAQVGTGAAIARYQYDGFGTRAAKWPGSSPDMAGDIDRDGRFSVLDARKLVLMAQGSLAPNYNADCDHDSAVTTQDAVCLTRKIIEQRQHPERFNQAGVLFLYDAAGHLFGEYRRNGQPIRETVWLYDQPVAVLQPNPQNPLITETYFVYADHLHAPRAIVDATDKLVWRWESEPFGNTPAEEDPDGDGQRFEYNQRFPGQYHDPETGLHYNLARYYDPAIGRYLQPDPIGLAGGMNPYAYVGNNPVSWVDPSGYVPIWLFPIIDYAGSAIIGAGTSAAVQYAMTGHIDLNQTLDDAHLGGLLGLINPALSTFTGFKAASGNATQCAIANGGSSFKRFMSAAETLNVTTERNSAVFYSGPENRALAESFAVANLRTTLDMTSAGRWLNAQKLFGPDSPLSPNEAIAVWSRLSQRFAEEASGNAVGFVTGARPSGIFNTVEFPALVSNPSIVNVLTGGH